jgi:hypothetical protein
VITGATPKVVRVWEHGAYYKTLSDFHIKLAGLVCPEYAASDLDKAIQHIVVKRYEITALKQNYIEHYFLSQGPESNEQVSVNTIEDKTYLIVRGFDPEFLNRNCTHVKKEGEEISTFAEAAPFLNELYAEAMAIGIDVIWIAYKEVSTTDDFTDLSGLTLAGMLQLMEAPKKGTKQF